MNYYGILIKSLFDYLNPWLGTTDTELYTGYRFLASRYQSSFFTKNSFKIKSKKAIKIKADTVGKNSNSHGTYTNGYTKYFNHNIGMISGRASVILKLIRTSKFVSSGLHIISFWISKCLRLMAWCLWLNVCGLMFVANVWGPA